MEHTPQPPSYDEATSNGLLQQHRPSVHFKSVVELFMKLKESGLDGSIHAALNTQNPHVTFDTKNTTWTTVDIEGGTEVLASEKSTLVPKLDPERHKWIEEDTPEDPCL